MIYYHTAYKTHLIININIIVLLDDSTDCS